MATPAQVYPHGFELCRQGAAVQEVFYVASGIVKLARSDRSGEEIIIDLAFTGAWVGSASGIIDVPSPVTAITCTTTSLERMPVRVFRDRLEHDPELSRRIHEVHARDLCRQTGRMAELSSRTSRERLERVMRQLILALGLAASPRGIRLQSPLRHWEIARLIAVTPEHLSRMLKQMEVEGVIRREKQGCMVVLDPTRLCGKCQMDSSRWCERAARQKCLNLNQECG